MSEYITDTNIVELRRSRTTISTTPEFAWQDGASDIRDLYEAELSRLRQERDELLGALRKCYVQMRFHFREHAELVPVGHYNSADYDATFEAEQCAQRVLAKHKPE